jgi:hypothetical protein
VKRRLIPPWHDGCEMAAMLNKIGSIAHVFPNDWGCDWSLALLDVVPASALSVKMTVCQGSCIRLSKDMQRKRSFFEVRTARAPDGTRGEIQTGSALK